MITITEALERILTGVAIVFLICCASLSAPDDPDDDEFESLFDDADAAESDQGADR
jgi:hypothetical protein